MFTAVRLDQITTVVIMTVALPLCNTHFFVLWL